MFPYLWRLKSTESMYKKQLEQGLLQIIFQKAPPNAYSFITFWGVMHSICKDSSAESFDEGISVENKQILLKSTDWEKQAFAWSLW